MNQDFADYRTAKSKHQKTKEVKAQLFRIRLAIEKCMEYEIDLMPYPPALIDAMASFHRQLAERCFV